MDFTASIGTSQCGQVSIAGRSARTAAIAWSSHPRDYPKSTDGDPLYERGAQATMTLGPRVGLLPSMVGVNGVHSRVSMIDDVAAQTVSPAHVCLGASVSILALFGGATRKISKT